MRHIFILFVSLVLVLTLAADDDGDANLVDQLLKGKSEAEAENIWLDLVVSTRAYHAEPWWTEEVKKFRHAVGMHNFIKEAFESFVKDYPTPVQ